MSYMDNLNQEFLEEYKRLDQLCKDFLGSDTGVSTYIAIMDDAPIDVHRYCGDWDAVYKSLKHLRWKRNKLAHEVGTLDEAFATKEDIDNVIYFYNQILSANDPLSTVRRAKKQEQEQQRLLAKRQEQEWQRQQLSYRQMQAMQTQKEPQQNQSFFSKIKEKIKSFFNN